MEAGCSFLPPVVVTQESYQNSMIRGIKTNSLPHPYEHRSCTVNTPTSYSQSLLFYNAHRFGTLHVDAHLRRRHFRRIYDLIHICLLRRKVDLAARFLKVLIQSHEWNHDLEWRLGLLTVAVAPQSLRPAPASSNDDSSNASVKLKLLAALDLSATFHFKATRLTEEMVVEYIASNRLVDAIELLESRVSIWPYKNQPSLHCYLGMLYLFVGVQKLLATQQTSSSSTHAQTDTSKGVDIRRLDRATRNKCRDCFTQVLYSTETWTAQELRRRQRIYYMYRKDLIRFEQRPVLKHKREQIWGTDPTRYIPDAETDPDAETEQDQRQIDEDQNGIDPDVTVTGREEVEVGSITEGADDDDGVEEFEDGSALPKSGPSVWPKYWPEVEHDWQVEKPWAWHVAREYLDLLFPGNIYTSAAAAAPTASRKTTRQDRPADGGVDDSAIRHIYVETSDENDPVSDQVTTTRSSSIATQSSTKRKRDHPAVNDTQHNSQHHDSPASRSDTLPEPTPSSRRRSRKPKPVPISPRRTTDASTSTRRKSKQKLDKPPHPRRSTPSKGF